jgi:ubiquitin-protein ligase
MKNQGQLRL